MDEMGEAGTGYHPGNPYGNPYGPEIYEKMTKREALLHELKEGKLTSRWRSDTEIAAEEEKKRQEEERKKQEEEKKEKERQARKKEIEESTDPSMDEIVTISFNGHPAYGSSFHDSMQITKREKMLIDEGFIDKYEMYSEKSRIRYEKRAEKDRRDKAEKIGEIMLNEDPKMDEIVSFKIYDGKLHHVEMVIVMRYRKTETIMGRRWIA